MMLALLLLLQALPQSIPTGCTWTVVPGVCADASAGPCLTLIPTCPPPAPYEIGDVAVLPSDDGGNAGLVLAQPVVVIAPAVLSTLSFYVVAPAGSLRLGLYDADCKTGLPGTLLAQAELGAVGAGWNATPKLLPVVALVPGTYWLAYAPADNRLTFRVDRLSGRALYFAAPYAAGFPAVWPTTGVTAIVSRWSMKAGVIGQ